MPTIAVAPIILTNALLTIGLDDYAGHISTARFDPTSPTTNWKGLKPTSVFTFTGKATWTCTLTLAQDWETPDSLSQYLHDHEGETVSAVFEPEEGGGSWSATLVIAPGAIGGDVDAVPTSTVTLGVQGKPVLTPAVP